MHVGDDDAIIADGADIMVADMIYIWCRDNFAAKWWHWNNEIEKKWTK